MALWRNGIRRSLKNSRLNRLVGSSPTSATIMIVTSSKEELKRDRINRLIQKCIDKKLIANEPKSIEVQEKLLNNYTPELLDNLEKIVDKH
jgi:hypothetical protein